MSGVVRPYRGVTEIQQFLLYRVDGIRTNALGRKYRVAVARLDTQHDVAATEVVEVVGEGADGVQHGFRVPAGLVLDALALNGTLAKQIVDVDGKCAGHADLRSAIMQP